MPRNRRIVENLTVCGYPAVTARVPQDNGTYEANEKTRSIYILSLFFDMKMIQFYLCDRCLCQRILSGLKRSNHRSCSVLLDVLS